MFQLFISSLQIIRMTISPAHNGRGVRYHESISHNNKGQNRDKIRLYQPSRDKRLFLLGPEPVMRKDRHHLMIHFET